MVLRSELKLQYCGTKGPCYPVPECVYMICVLASADWSFWKTSNLTMGFDFFFFFLHIIFTDNFLHWEHVTSFFPTQFCCFFDYSAVIPKWFPCHYLHNSNLLMETDNDSILNVYFICLKGRVIKREDGTYKEEKEKYSIHCFIPQMTTRVRDGLGWSWESGAPSRFPMWLMGS